MKKIVVDTNVLVSGLLFGGPPGEVVDLWKQKRVKPLCSKQIVEEYLRVLAYPKSHLSESDIDFIFTNEIIPYFDFVMVKIGKPFVAADPADDIFIWCALKGRANAIVSGDEHLLGLSTCPVPVLSVVDFLKTRGLQE